MSLRSLLFVAVGLTAASPAFAVGFDADLMGGQRTATEKFDQGDGTTLSQKITATEVTGAFHVVPFMFPLALGVTVSSVTYDTGKADTKNLNALGDPDYTFDVSGKLAGLEYGPEAVLWAPLPFVKPYVRIGYLMGSYKETGTLTATPTAAGTAAGASAATATAADNYTSSGTEVGLGLRISPWPLISIVVEYNIENEQRKFKSGSTTSNGVSTPDTAPGPASFGSSAVRLGLHVGI